MAGPSRVTPAYDVVLLDLDGTIIHSEPGVHISVQYALERGFGIVPTQAQLEEFMGPPLAEVLPRVFGLSDAVDEQRFFELYCERYFHDAEYEFDLYPGMGDLVRDLAECDCSVVLATAKPQESAERILDRAGLIKHFAFVAGSASDGSRQDKAEVLEHAFASIAADGRTHRVVMVGDRALDVQAARAHGVEAIAVTWGYAEEGELESAGATHLAGDVAQLRSVLLG